MIHLMQGCTIQDFNLPLRWTVHPMSCHVNIKNKLKNKLAKLLELLRPRLFLLLHFLF
jgi:hypothetical protein